MDENFELITVEKLNTIVYEVRGQQVMLDRDLAEIYGYTTKALNQQVTNNSEKFDEEFCFQLTKEELADLRSKNLTANISPKSRILPHVFTEQGIYMLMTVLNGELAIKQSKALVKAFKVMKDYIIQTQGLVTRNEHNLLTSQVMLNTEKIDNLASSIDLLNHNLLIEDNLKQWVFINGEKFEADIAYINMFQKAKKSIYLIDDYVNLKTLEHLSQKAEGVDVVIFTQNQTGYGGSHLTPTLVHDFNDEYPTLRIKPNPKSHDRWIVIDYDTENEIVYHSGPSVKDAARKICTMNTLDGGGRVHEWIPEMLEQEDILT